jgi:hypothetical protein
MHKKTHNDNGANIKLRRKWTNCIWTNFHIRTYYKATSKVTRMGHTSFTRGKANKNESTLVSHVTIIPKKYLMWKKCQRMCYQKNNSILVCPNTIKIYCTIGACIGLDRYVQGMPNVW